MTVFCRVYGRLLTSVGSRLTTGVRTAGLQLVALFGEIVKTLEPGA